MWNQLRMHPRILCPKHNKIMCQRLPWRVLQKQLGTNLRPLPERMQHLYQLLLLHHLQQWRRHMVPVRMLHLLFSFKKILHWYGMYCVVPRRHFLELDVLPALQFSMQDLRSPAIKLYNMCGRIVLIEQLVCWDMSLQFKGSKWKRVFDVQELWYC
jgi:hypothetical protein